MIEEDLTEILFKHVEEHQLDEGNLSYSAVARAAAIQKKLSVMTLNSGISDLSLKQGDSSNCQGFDEKLSSVLLHLVDKVMETDLSNNSQDPVERIMDLVSALVAIYSEEVAEPIVARTIQFSTVLLERVRAQASNFMGYLALHLSQRKEEWAMEWFEALKDALLPRMTDKSQSVRNSAIRASGKFFTDLEKQTETEDLLEMLLWNLWHDPSVSNRVAALDALPVTKETVDHIVTRIRDVKEKVRIQAVEILRNKVDPSLHMTSDHFAEIMRSGLSARCTSTKEATMKLICSTWMKAAKFNPVNLLKLMGVIINEEECEKGMKVILDVARSGDWTLLDELSEPEIRAFQASITLDKSIEAIISSESTDYTEEVYFARIVTTTAQESSSLSANEKFDILNKVPDVPLWCEYFAKYSFLLAEATSNGESMKEDEYAFICLQLLQLVKVIGLQEEGSRRHFSSFMQGILSSKETPDDLVEGCIESLRAAHQSESDFLRAINQIIENLSSEGDGKNCQESLRILSILTIVLENASSAIASDSLFQEASRVIVTSVTSSDGLVREAAVSCLGKLGLFTEKTNLLATFKPILLQIAIDEKERLEIRSQALLALSDWSMLFSEMLHPCQVENQDISFLNVVEGLLEHENPSVVAIAAEVGIKLLFSGSVCERNLIAHLLVLFFEPDQHKDDVAIELENKEVGSMVRLQQLLSLFFTAYCIKSEHGRTAVLGALESALGLAFNQKRKKKLGFPFLKMIEFVYSIVESGMKIETSKEANIHSSSDTIDSGGEMNKTTNVALSVSTQVAKFLVSTDSLPVTLSRALCKFLSNQEITADKNDKVDLMTLKDLMEEVSMVISDASSLRSLSQLSNRLADIDLQDFEGSSEDTESEGELEIPKESSNTVGNSTVEDNIVESMATLSVGNKENVGERSSITKSKAEPSGRQRRSARRHHALESL